MGERRQIDLTYITERIITLHCPPGCPEEVYLQGLQHIVPMLQSKHRHNYMIINLSQKHAALTTMKHKILNTGWVDLLAPSLDHIINVCTLMEKWLQNDQKHVLVLHCRGEKGLLGVLLASYIYFSNMSASADLSLDHFAMRRFYNDKLAALMTPSQRRYVWMLGNMLKGVLRMRPSPSFLLCVVLHGLPKIRPDGGCSLFLRVYQSLQAVCTSAVHHVNPSQTDRLYFVLQPAQLLKGDIMVVCYDKNSGSPCRQVIFRLQFHTGLVVGHSLTFHKADLDSASQDSRFPEDGKVELLLSESPEKFAGRELWLNGAGVTVDYDTLDPRVRRDSFQDSSYLDAAFPHIQEAGDGSLFPEVKTSEERHSFALPAGSTSLSDRTPSASSDSGLSVASQGRTTARPSRGVTQDKSSQAGRLVTAPSFQIIQPLLEVMTELAARGGRSLEDTTGDESGLGYAVNGEVSSSERETDILEDDYEGHDVAALGLEIPNSSSVCSLSSETQIAAQNQYSTHAWVQQQQIDASIDNLERPPHLLSPDTLPFGLSNRDGEQRGLVLESTDITDNEPRSTNPTRSSQVNEMESLATDMDESIDQLNQLIMDLDPTFVPDSTHCSHLSRSVSLHTNGLSRKGHAHLSGWKQQKQITDVTDYVGLRSPGWTGGGSQSFRGPADCGPSFSSTPLRDLHKTNSVAFRRQTDAPDVVPSTPAFPVSPPTPYVKSFSELLQHRTGRQWDHHAWTQDSRSFLESINHSGGPADGDLFRSDASVAPSCQRAFGSMCSVSSESPLPHTDSSTPPVWHERTPNSTTPTSMNSLYPQPSPPLSLSAPNAHSSPRGPTKVSGESPTGVRRETTDSTDFSSLLLGNGGLDHSLLAAMEGLNIGLGGGLAPLLPEKKRAGDVGELSSRSPSLSGFSSPHSGSSFSIPLSSSVTPDPLRGLSGTPSPGGDSGNKHDNGKFVQDTSKFWYKPDISRDQAIAALKDKEPGSFIVRDSHSFRGAYGLAMKVATPPPSVMQQSKKVGDLSNELVRHFLIECTQKGVRLKGCPNEPYFGSLTALVCQHSITPLALPCKLILPDRDPVEESTSSPSQTATNSAAELLKQGAACNVWYLFSVELESLTGHQAVQKATTQTLAMDPPPSSTVVHFKVSAQGITLTDNQRKLFFRRHYAVNTVIFCSLDPQGRKWTRDSGSTAKIFGFVARKSQSDTENVCHLFAEHDPEQPASAIVNFVSKVMIGSHKK